MIKYVVLYAMPEDTAAFDDWYFTTHLPLLKAVPGLGSAEAARVRRTVAGEPALYLLAELRFDSYESLKKALGTSEWSALSADLQRSGFANSVSVHIADILAESGRPT